MSAINNALSELASNHSHKPEQVVKAQVKPVKQLKVLPWVIGSFGLSLAVGGWAISSRSPELPQQPVSVTESTIQIASPTSKPSESSGVIYNPQSRTVNKPTKPAPVTEEKAQDHLPQPLPIVVASVSQKPTQVAQGEVVIQQIELSPAQLAEKAETRAKKALDDNNLKEALGHYQEALRYAPNSVKIRQKLSALYYGKGEARKAVDLSLIHI